MFTTQKKVQKNDKIIMESIKQKINVMKESQFRTTNFSLIEYFAENDFNPLYEKDLISRILTDYRLNPSRYVLSNIKGNFKSEKSFLNSVKNSISKNQAFVKGPKFGLLSLNLEKTYQYLKMMYQKYINNSSKVATPYKLFNNSKINKASKPLPTIEEFNIENNSESKEEDMDIDELKPNLEKKHKHIGKKNNSYGFLLSSIHSNKDENVGENDDNNLSLNFPNSIGTYSINSTANINSEERQIEYNKEHPEIFVSQSYIHNIYSFLNNGKISYLIKLLNEYLLNSNKKYIDDKIKQNLEGIIESLRSLFDNKKLYDGQYAIIKNCQLELYNIYKKIYKQFRIIKIETGSKTYTYATYVKLRDLIFNYEICYNEIVELMSQKLKELKDIEKEITSKRIIIKDYLKDLSYEYLDLNFSLISSSIEEILKTNNFNQNYNTLDIYLNKENNYGSVEYIIKLFLSAKDEIIEEINNIDKFIGNITIEE